MAGQGQGTLHVSLVSPERVWFEGDVDSVVAPAFDGKVGILPRHAPMVTLLGEGATSLAGAPSRWPVGFCWWSTIRYAS